MALCARRALEKLNGKNDVGSRGAWEELCVL